MTVNQSFALDVIAPLEQEGTKAVLRTWLKSAGETVSKDDPIVELETDKVVVEVSAPCDGVLEIVLHEGQDAEPGALLGRVQQLSRLGDSSVTGLATDTADSAYEFDSLKFDPELRLSPSVRRLVAEHNLDVHQMIGEGSGRDGRLTRDDVVKVIAKRNQAGATAVEHVPSSDTPSRKASEPSSPSQEAPVVVTRISSGGAQAEQRSSQVLGGPRVAAHVPHSTMRRKIAEHMQHSVSSAPHVTAVFEADFSAIISHRERNKSLYADQGVNLTFTAYFVAAAAEAMRVAPEVNSRWHDDYMELYKDVNIGIGAALGDKGLIVPVIRQAQDLSLLGIASRLQELTVAARSGKLKPSDVQGGTFTISNHGVSGSLFASPIIINQPQSAILGIGALEKRVVVRELDGQPVFQARPLAYVSLTIDHRVLDGSQTNAWLARFVEVIEGWRLES